MEYQVHNWYHFCWLSGDNICEQHVHNLDVCNWAKGDQHPVEANGMGGCLRPLHGREQGRGPDLRPPLRRVHLRRRTARCSASAATSRMLEQRLRGGPRHPGHFQRQGSVQLYTTEGKVAEVKKAPRGGKKARAGRRPGAPEVPTRAFRSTWT